MKHCAIYALILFITASCALNKKQKIDKLSASLCQDILVSKPKAGAYNNVFSDTFKKNLNEQQFNTMTRSIVNQHGECEKITQATEQGILTVLTKTGNNLSFELRPSENENTLQGLFFHGVKNDLNRFRKKAQWVCDQLVQGNPDFKYEDHFTKSFRKAIPYTKLTEISKSLHKDFGECKSIEVPNNALVKEFYTIQKNGKKLVFNLVVENKGETNKISGLLFKGEKTNPISFKSADDILKELKKFDGTVSALIIENDKKILDFQSGQKHALGSVFKLYVLATLANEVKNKNLSWDQTFPIKNSDKSLPSGVMQNFKKGKKVTIKEFANKMISISDNTATDHLISILGREKIEKFIEDNGFILQKSNFKPFLKTKELFAIRAFFNDKDYKIYEKSDRAKRLKMIKRLSKSNKRIMSKLKKWDTPRGITQIEWFASPQEVCRLKFWLKRQNDVNIRTALSLNAPFAQEEKSYQYTGYKGGSEPGVLEMAYLLKKGNDQWSCLYLGQNNTKQAINHSKFFQLAQSILKWHGSN